MTLPRPRRRTRSLLLRGLILSLLVHLIGGGLWALWARTVARAIPKPTIWASRQEALPAAATIIRIEHRPTAAAAPPHENRVERIAPRPHPVATIVPAAPLPKHEIARYSAHAPPQAPAAAFATAPVVTPRRIRPVAHAVVSTERAYSDRQMATLTQSFTKTIADSRQTLGSVQSASEQTPIVTMKQYTMHVAGIHEGMNPGDGDIWPISRQRIGNTMWYYVRYSYVHGDGTYESDSVPWPFHYAIGDDPFARGDKRIPLQPPPAGYKPDRLLKPILMHYFGGPDVLD